jgi:hypothetical protein
MDGLISTNRHKIKCWVYGHTHTPTPTPHNVLINNIPFLCNPIGYPNQNEKINFQKIITI